MVMVLISFSHELFSVFVVNPTPFFSTVPENSQCDI